MHEQGKEFIKINCIKVEYTPNCSNKTNRTSSQIPKVLISAFWSKLVIGIDLEVMANKVEKLTVSNVKFQVIWEVARLHKMVKTIFELEDFVLTDQLNPIPKL